MCIIFVLIYTLCHDHYSRIVDDPPLYFNFKTIGVRGHSLKPILLTLDEFETFRLANQLFFSHSLAADEMEILAMVNAVFKTI